MIKYLILKILKIFDLYNQLKIFRFLKKKNYKSFRIFFDIGAHKGESIILFSKNFQINTIYSFEPSPKNFQELSKNKNLLQSKFKHLKMIFENYALGTESKKLLIKQLDESSSSTINDINENSNYFKRKSFFLNNPLKKKFFIEMEIDQITLSDYMNQNQISKIDFLKIDTEGYEFKVLQGLGKNISNVSLIMFEHHYHNMLIKNYTFGNIHDLLIKNNFKQIYKYKMSFRKTFEYIYEKT